MGRSRGRKISEETVLVVGLGLFGSAVARALTEMHVPIIAITDDHLQAVHYADDFTHVIEMDPSDREALEQIGIKQIRKAVVALSKVELSIMTFWPCPKPGSGKSGRGPPPRRMARSWNASAPTTWSTPKPRPADAWPTRCRAT